MSEDFEGFDAGDYNLFRYCHNDPEDLTDPMGTEITLPPGPNHATSILEDDRSYNFIMGLMQRQFSSAISAGLVGYQQWSAWSASQAMGGLTMGQQNITTSPRSLTSKFPVKGGTYGQRQKVRDDIKQILKTSRGKDYLAEVDQRGYGVTTHLTKENDAYADDAPSAHVRIDFRYHPNVETTAGIIPATTTRLLAHEFGHAIMGTQDDGPGRMNNIRQNETPIMLELGEPERLSY
jgi:hypothetical protein